MKKTVYSLVLSEDVVEAVDRMSYANGTSRSNMINHILAQAVGYVTPEQRMAEILETLSAQMTGMFQLQTQATDGLLVIRSPLRYRYKPTIRYRVELYRHPESAFARLQASFRTQNQQLLAEAERFFTIWMQLEQAAGRCNAADAGWENGVWTRIVRLQPALANDTQKAGEAMGGYIKQVDAALKAYFAALPDTTAAVQAVTANFSA